MSRLSLALIALVLTTDIIPSAYADSRSPIEAGQRLYRTATRADGTALRALVQSDVELPAKAAACVNCHRRSGIGVSEGGSRSPNLTAPVLFAATEKPPIRPAYDDALLTRAIVAGIAADGRLLDVTMPHYDLTADDTASLVAYLRSLGSQQPDGVTDTDIHIATVVSTSASDDERSAVLGVLHRYIEVKNSESRRESKRAAASNRHYYGHSTQRAYRTWQLHVWSLDGAESTWPRQLEKLYSETTPFALVSGAVGSGWPVVHRFCEENEIPCVLPLGDALPATHSGFYSLYFSKGAVLEASVTAEHIANSGLPAESKILVVGEKNAMSQAAIDTLVSRLAAQNFENISTYSTRAGKSLSPRKWNALLKAEHADILVSWIPVSAMSGLTTDRTDLSLVPRRIYTAQSFSDWTQNDAADKLLRERIYHVYPYSLPKAGLTQFPREDIWLRLQGLSELDDVAAAKALFACRTFGMGLADIQSNFSREYFMESLEHALDGTQLTSIFPRTSLGPDQRFLARGAYVVQLARDTDNVFSNPEWVQP